MILEIADYSKILRKLSKAVLLSDVLVIFGFVISDRANLVNRSMLEIGNENFRVECWICSCLPMELPGIN